MRRHRPRLHRLPRREDSVMRPTTRPPCLRAKNADFWIIFARKQGGTHFARRYLPVNPARKPGLRKTRRLINLPQTHWLIQPTGPSPITLRHAEIWPR